MSYMGMFNQMLTVTRTEVVKDPLTHIASKKEVPYGPYPCSSGKSSGNFIQSQPMGKTIQNLKIYTIAGANIKSGDIVTVDGVNYIVENPYKPRNHHLECDITLQSEV